MHGPRGVGVAVSVDGEVIAVDVRPFNKQPLLMRPRPCPRARISAWRRTWRICRSGGQSQLNARQSQIYARPARRGRGRNCRRWGDRRRGVPLRHGHDGQHRGMVRPQVRGVVDPGAPSMCTNLGCCARISVRRRLWRLCRSGRQSQTNARQSQIRARPRLRLRVAGWSARPGHVSRAHQVSPGTSGESGHVGPGSSGGSGHVRWVRDRQVGPGTSGGSGHVGPAGPVR